MKLIEPVFWPSGVPRDESGHRSFLLKDPILNEKIHLYFKTLTNACTMQFAIN